MKKQIINNLLPLLDRAGGIRYVVEPQSPFVMDNPDVLAIVNNSVFGIYVPSSYEKKNIDSFLRRVYTSRLVYARDLKTILLFDDDEKEAPGKKNLWSAFHRILETRHLEEVVSVIDSDRKDTRIKMLSKRVRSYATETYYKYINLGYNTRQYRGKFAEVYSEQWQELPKVQSWADQTRGKGIKSGYYADGSFLFSKSKTKGMSVRESLDGILTYSLFSQYSLDNGQLYIRDDKPQINLLNTDLLVKDEDLMWASSLAYVGVAPVSVDSLQALSEIHKKGLKLFGIE
jgi:hypothetical protein